MPLFTRNPEERRSFFTNWLETSIIRDAARAYGARYNPDIAWSVLRQMGTVLAEGEIPTLKHFKQGSRSLRKYLQTLEDIFLLQKLNPHDASVAREVWLPTDTGIAAHLMGGTMGEGRSLSLGRIFVLKEIRAVAEYSGKRIQPLYYKSARGSPVDLIPLRPRPRFQILSLATGRCFHSSSIRRDRDGLPDWRSTPAWRGGSKPGTWRSESVQSAELVPVEIAKIGQIELTRAAFAHARRAFTRRAASSKASRMPGICLSGRCSGKTDRHAIGARRGLAINGFCDGENAARRSIKDPVPIDFCGRHAKRTQYGIIESFRALQIIGANHDVGKHRLSSFC